MSWQKIRQNKRKIETHSFFFLLHVVHAILRTRVQSNLYFAQYKQSRFLDLKINFSRNNSIFFHAVIVFASMNDNEKDLVREIWFIATSIFFNFFWFVRLTSSFEQKDSKKIARSFVNARISMNFKKESKMTSVSSTKKSSSMRVDLTFLISSFIKWNTFTSWDFCSYEFKQHRDEKSQKQ